MQNLSKLSDLYISAPIEGSALGENSWKDLFGIFKDDAYFQEVVEIIQAEREALGDEEIDSAYYEPQGECRAFESRYPLLNKSLYQP